MNLITATRIVAAGAEITPKVAAKAIIYFINTITTSVKNGESFRLGPIGQFIVKNDNPEFHFSPGFLKEIGEKEI